MAMGTGVGTKMRRVGMGASGIENGNIVNCLKLFSVSYLFKMYPH